MTKTKAEKWLEQRPEWKSTGGILAYVDSDGDLYIEDAGGMTVAQALQLRDWLTETFDTVESEETEDFQETFVDIDFTKEPLHTHDSQGTFADYGKDPGHTTDLKGTVFTQQMLEDALENLQHPYKSLHCVDGEWRIRGRKLKVFPLYCMMYEYINSSWAKVGTLAEKMDEWAQMYDLSAQNMTDIRLCVTDHQEEYSKWKEQNEKEDEEDIQP
jgi:hypothetical protein